MIDIQIKTDLAVTLTTKELHDLALEILALYDANKTAHRSRKRPEQALMMMVMTQASKPV